MFVMFCFFVVVAVQETEPLKEQQEIISKEEFVSFHDFSMLFWIPVTAMLSTIVHCTVLHCILFWKKVPENCRSGSNGISKMFKTIFQLDDTTIQIKEIRFCPFGAMIRLNNIKSLNKSKSTLHFFIDFTFEMLEMRMKTEMWKSFSPNSWEERSAHNFQYIFGNSKKWAKSCLDTHRFLNKCPIKLNDRIHMNVNQMNDWGI